MKSAGNTVWLINDVRDVQLLSVYTSGLTGSSIPTIHKQVNLVTISSSFSQSGSDDT